jgi:hypothetical protein
MLRSSCLGMINAPDLMAVALETAVALVALVMARKCVSAGRWLPFHERGAKASWDSLAAPVQQVVLTLLRLTGFGFLVVGLLLLAGAVAVRLAADDFARLTPPGVAVVYCAGLSWANLRLHRATGAPTPWRGALAAAFLLVAAIVLLAVRR